MIEQTYSNPWILLSLGVAVLSIFSIFIPAINHLRLAKSTQLPYVFMPISELNMWFLFLVTIPPFRWVVNEILPQWLADYVNTNTSTTRWAVKDRMAEKYGSVYVIASPGDLFCAVADAGVAYQIFKKRMPKPVHQYGMLDIYGTNLVTASDVAWPHHKRNTTGAFNEVNNSLVWSTTVQKAISLVGGWTARQNRHTGSSIVQKPNTDILKLALYVLSGASYGVDLSWNPSETTGGVFEKAPDGFKLTFKEAVEYIGGRIDDVFLALMLPSWFPFQGEKKRAHMDLGNYFELLISMARRGDITHHLAGKDSLLWLMVRSAEEESEYSGKTVEKSEARKHTRRPLSNQELIGNLFIFTLAGHETTSTTLQYSIMMLALHPEQQEWLCKQIDDVLGDQAAKPAQWSYEELFPKLVGPLCVMLETLRMFPPVPTVPKWTGETSQVITYKGNDYTLPPHTNINIDTSALHYRAEYWGPDAYSYDLQRWDRRNSESFLAQNEGKPGLISSGLEHETIHRPLRGAYVPFSDGFRACVGRKFAQVEFVAAITVLFSQYNVRIASRDGESMEMAEKRAWNTINKSITGITLVISEDVGVELTPRKAA